MAGSGNIYANAIDKAFSGSINWASDSIKMALLTSTYTPNLATHVNFSDLTNEVVGTGYTAGGAALATKTHTVTAANSWGTSRANTTAYNYGDIVRPATGNGFLYMAVSGSPGATAGTTGGSIPTYPTIIGQTVVDGTVTWMCIGESISQWSSAAATWATASITARYGVIYDAQSGVGTTEPLIALIDFGSDFTSTGATFTVSPATLGWFWLVPF